MLLIKNGRVLDPATGLDGFYDILVDDKVIAKIGFVGSLDDMARESAIMKITENVMLSQLGQEAPGDELEEIDAGGCIVAPGLVDAHVHFRDPGFIEKEDIFTGAEAAKAGGFTTVVMMGNTNPHMDNEGTIRYALEKGAQTGIHVYTCGNITKAMEGHELTDMESLIKSGAVLLTDDGKPITDPDIMKKACIEAAGLEVVLSLHEEDPSFITENGVNAGSAAASLGLTGSPREAEISMVKRDIAIADETGASITIQHISTKEAVDMIREARKTNPHIHAEATPHHFTLNDKAVEKHGTMAKMNPPLREEEDRLAIINGLADGTIETIATDHAPHTNEEKAQEFAKAPSGIIGLETSLGLGIRELVNKGYMSLMTLLSRMTIEPSVIYKLPSGRIGEGLAADLVIFNPDENKVYDKFASKADNSPFKGETLPGRIKYTICDGKIVYCGENR